MGVLWSRELPLIGHGQFRVSSVDLITDQILARVFYPTNGKTSTVSWLPRNEYLDGLAAYRKTSPRLLRFLVYFLTGGVILPIGRNQSPSLASSNGSRSQSPSLASSNGSRNPSPSLAPSTGSRRQSPSLASSNGWPVVVFSHGLAGCRHFYAFFCASLASYGFVVAAIEHRDRSASWTATYSCDVDGQLIEKGLLMRQLQPDDKEFNLRNEQLNIRVSECLQLLHQLERINDGRSDCLTDEFDWTQFQGQLNLSRPTIIGHSFGAATALAVSACSKNKFQNVIGLDSWMFPIHRDTYANIRLPTLFLNANDWQWAENVNRMRQVINGEMYTLSGVNHYSFSDWSIVAPPWLAQRAKLVGRTEPRLAMEAILELCVAFLRDQSTQSKTFDALSDVAERYSQFVAKGSPLSQIFRSNL